MTSNTKCFEGFDLSTFWNTEDYALRDVDEPVTDALVASIEKELKVRLPNSYIELMKTQNGGFPENNCFPTKTSTTWAEDHISIRQIMGIGRKDCSICGDSGDKYMKKAWGYPNIGICIGTCPSAGHDMIMLDYRKCGKTGEPSVVHVDQEVGYRITFLAKDFETFIRGLVDESVYDPSQEDLERDLERVLKIIETGKFSTLLTNLILASGEPKFEPLVRNACRRMTIEMGHFSPCTDEHSLLFFDLQFYLYSLSNKVTDAKAYFKVYPDMIACSGAEFTSGGYSTKWVEEWLTDRLSSGKIVTTAEGNLQFSDQFQKQILSKLP